MSVIIFRANKLITVLFDLEIIIAWISITTVIIPPLITLEPTEFTVQNTIAYREGESFTLPCAASGIPEPT